MRKLIMTAVFALAGCTGVPEGIEPVEIRVAEGNYANLGSTPEVGDQATGDTPGPDYAKSHRSLLLFVQRVDSL